MARNNHRPRLINTLTLRQLMLSHNKWVQVIDGGQVIAEGRAGRVHVPTTGFSSDRHILLLSEDWRDGNSLYAPVANLGVLEEPGSTPTTSRRCVLV